MPTYLNSFAKERRLRIGIAGAGRFGLLLSELSIGTGKAEIVAVCDVDNERLKGSTEKLEHLQGKRPATFRDYRDMLDMKELESVFIAHRDTWVLWNGRLPA
jgi:predicted dehydrogenase